MSSVLALSLYLQPRAGSRFLLDSGLHLCSELDEGGEVSALREVGRVGCAATRKKDK